jgi:hydrogenase-4 component B
MPWTASLFALGAAAISGLPPLNGFVSEWLIYLGLFEAAEGRGPAAWLAVPAAVSLAITGALALACFVKVVGIVFLGLPRSKQAEQARECGPLMRCSMLFLAAICVLIGLFPIAIEPVLKQTVTAWNPAWTPVGLDHLLTNVGAANLVFLGVAMLASWALLHRVQQNGMRRGLTWDCGYAAPAARMQYTAGSFAATITGWFGWILRPETHRVNPEGLFPGKAAAAEHTPETVLEKLIFPVSGLVMRLSTEVRRYQHGRLQAYILYLVFGLAALAIIAWLGARL